MRTNNRKTVVTLTESDLARIVRRVIKENEEEMFLGPKIRDGGMSYYDTSDRPVRDDIEFSETREFGPDDYESFIEFINSCNAKWCRITKNMYDTYVENRGGFIGGKGRRK